MLDRFLLGAKPDRHNGHGNGSDKESQERINVERVVPLLLLRA